MYNICKPRKIDLYINAKRKTMEQIYRELGGGQRKIILINCGLFDGAFRPCCWLRKDGTTLHSEAWSDFGFGWDKGTLIMDTSDHITQYHNFVSCVALVRVGVPISPLGYPDEMGGIRGRTAIGVRASGEVIVWCTQDGSAYACAPEQLREEMLKLGCRYALMLDGGISSRGIFPDGTIPANKNRPYLHNYLVLYLDDAPEPEEPVANPQIPACPYAEPTHNVRWGSIGEGAKWVQWQLNRHGATLDVDGWFFGQSVEALKKFQHSRGLAWDGVCGELTREALKK